MRAAAASPAILVVWLLMTLAVTAGERGVSPRW